MNRYTTLMLAVALVGAACKHSTLSRRAQAKDAYQRQDFARCAELHGQLDDWYSSACCEAKGGQTSRAFEALDRALENEPQSLDPESLQADTDLNSLHADARWATLLKRVAAARSELNAELLELAAQDQADRDGRHEWAEVQSRDQARRARVTAILDAGKAGRSGDYFHAALIFQHGETPADAHHAHELALKAVELNAKSSAAKWLAAATEDRELMFEGKPQKYGTQYKLDEKSGHMKLWQVDPKVTDDERAKWNVPPLSEAAQSI